MKLSSSVIVARAWGKTPDGVPAPHAGRCAFCGLEIAEGDPYVPFEAGSYFMDDLTLAARGSGMTCGHCVHLLSAQGLRDSGHGIFSETDGALPFRKWADIARALREPPRPPFVAVYATANNQHMAWRAPINFSRDLFYVRVGLRDLKIRRPVLLAAVDACMRVGEFMGIPATAKSLSHPFIHLSNDLKDHAHSLLRRKGPNDTSPTLEEAAQALPRELELIGGLTLGETWALRFLLSPNAGSEN